MSRRRHNRVLRRFMSKGPDLDDATSDRILTQEVLTAYTIVLQRLAAKPSDVSQASIICAHGLCCGLGALETDTTRARKASRKRYPNLLNALCTFLLTPRPKEIMLALKATFSRCKVSCDMSDPDVYMLHEPDDDNIHLRLQSENPLDEDFNDFILYAFEVLSQFLSDLRPGVLETVHEESSAALAVERRSRTGRGGSQQRVNSSTPTLTGYEGLARSLVPNVDETIQSCLEWFDLTKSSLVLTFVHRCADLFPARVYPAVIKRPDFNRLVVEEAQRFVDDQIVAHANGDALADISSFKILSDRAGFLFVFGLNMLELEQRRTFLGPYAVAYYHTLIQIMDLFEPPNVFSSIPVADLDEGEPEVQRSKIVENARLQAFGMWNVITLECPEAEIDGLNEETFPLDPRIKNCERTSEITKQRPGPELDDIKFQVLYRLLNSDKAVRFDPAGEFEHYEFDALRDAFSWLYNFSTRVECTNVDCGKKPGLLDKPFATCAGCGVLRYCSRECQRHAWNHKRWTGYDKCAHKPSCKTIRRLRTLWGDLLPSAKHSQATGFELYRRLYDNLPQSDDASEDSSAPDTVNSAIQEHGINITQGELRELGSYPGIIIEADRPDSEMIHLDGVVALDLLSQERLPNPVLARFLADEDFPSLCVGSLTADDAGIEDFIGRSTMMRIVSRTNQAKNSTDWGARDLNADEFEALNQEPTYMTVVQGWANRA